MRLALLVVLMPLAALAEGFFVHPAASEPERGMPSCMEAQTLVCTVSCAPLAGLPDHGTQACLVSSCHCEAHKVDAKDAGASVAIVTFGIKQMLGLPVAK